MVQVLESNPTFAQQIGRSTGAALGKTGSEFAENLALKKKGIDVAGLTGYARDVAIKEGMKRAMLLQQGRNTLVPQGEQQGTQPFQGSQPTPGTPAQPGQTPPSRAGGGSKVIIPPEQIEQEAVRRGRAKIARGEPTDLQTEIGLIQQENANTGQYKQYQEQLGNQAEEELLKAYKSAKPEEIASFRRKGEELATQGLSESQIKKQLAIESRKYANEVKNLRNVQGTRMHHKIGQTLSGTSRSDEERNKAIRSAAKPFLDRGEHSVVRNELSSKGYGPEEIEGIISDLSEQTKKSLNDFPKVSTPFRKTLGIKTVENPSYRAFEGNPEAQQKFSQNLQNTLQKDPNTNLLLLRKAYEDKGVDWNSFKTEFDNLMESGQFQPNDEQSKMLEYLQEPPLNRLELLLSEMNWWGR